MFLCFAAATAAQPAVADDTTRTVIQASTEAPERLEDCLSRLTEKWDVSFIFDSRIVKEKAISIPTATEFPESQLREQLAAAGLTLYKIRERTFAIGLAKRAPDKISYAREAPTEAPLIDTILITGSRIPQTNAVAASPVTTIGNVEFDIRGSTRVEDVVNTLPQAFGAQGANITNGATGTAQVSLRGLGPNRTLVLVNGHRLQYGSSISAAPDLNQIPGALVERIEVLTGGASAVYGSDAIAGVVNFIMMSDFEGVRINGQLHGYQHGNDNPAAQDVLIATGGRRGSDFDIPKANVFDGKGQDITLIIGANTADGKGNVTAYAGYRNNDAILQADRDYSRCPYAGGDPVFTCIGSPVTPNGRFLTAFGDYTLDEDGPGDTFRARTLDDTFNYNTTTFYQRPDERFTLGAFAHYQVNENIEFYSETMFYDYRSDAQVSYTGTFFASGEINCDNPFISTTPNADGVSQLDAICGAASDNGTPDDFSDDFIIPGSGDSAAGDALFYPGKRFVEAEPRYDSIRLTSYRMLGGVRGDVMEGWDYNLYFQYANTHNSQTYNNDAVIPNIRDALFAIDDGAGNVVCRNADARARGCIPLNLFEIGGVTQEQLDYVIESSFQDGDTKQYLAEGVLTGDLGVYGLHSPWADEGVDVALGAQWRKEKLSYRPDILFEQGLLFGINGEVAPVSGQIETTDFFVEAQIPVVTDLAFADALDFHGGYRHSDVSTSGSYSTWKLQGDWRIIPEIRIRGGWQRAARAANVIEAFSPQAVDLVGFLLLENGESDPCAGTDPLRTLEECMRTGVTAAQYGSIHGNPVNQYNAVTGGNPEITPEIANISTIGAVFTAYDYAPGALSLSIDYFDISVDGFVGSLLADASLTQCLNTGAEFFCNLIHRNAEGELWGTQDAFVETRFMNTGSLSTSGFDVNMDWRVDFNELGLGDAGSLAINLIGTYLLQQKTKALPGGPEPAYDCAGWYGGRCGGPRPEWRHKMTTTWQTPIGIDATLTWRYLSSVILGDSDQGPFVAPTDQRYKLGSRNYIDLQASYSLTDNLNVRVGVNNLMDKDPPLTITVGGVSNGNTYPQTYDAQGRFLFAGATIDF